MGKNGFLKAALFLALFIALAVGVSAQVTISGGFALSSMEYKVVIPGGDTEFGGSDIGFGGNVYVDYLLPIGIPLSLGFEGGIDTAKVDAEWEWEEDKYDSGGTVIVGTETITEKSKITGYTIPLLARVAYHFDLMANLDLYLVGKVGYVLGWEEDEGVTLDGYGGIGFGADVGAAFYFTPRLGVFAEGGFDRYNLKREEDVEYFELQMPFSRFFTVGISTKF
jgi:hypothetical protein